LFSVTEDLTTSSSTFLGGSSTFFGGSSVFLGKTKDFASSAGFFELVISPETDFTKGLLIGFGASSLGFSRTGSFFQGLLFAAGFSGAATGYCTGLSSVCFLFQGKDTAPLVGALTSSFLGAVLLDTVAPKGANSILVSKYLTLCWGLLLRNCSGKLLFEY
jgi:hypothetical protein